MQYTLRNVPAVVDALLRRRAQEERKSLNEVTLESIMRGLGLEGEPTPRRDLSDVAGAGAFDETTLDALAEQRRIDEDLWR
jgi:hypothetical protein